MSPLTLQPLAARHLYGYDAPNASGTSHAATTHLAVATVIVAVVVVVVLAVLIRAAIGTRRAFLLHSDHLGDLTTLPSALMS